MKPGRLWLRNHHALLDPLNCSVKDQQESSSSLLLKDASLNFSQSESQIVANSTLECDSPSRAGDCEPVEKVEISSENIENQVKGKESSSDIITKEKSESASEQVTIRNNANNERSSSVIILCPRTPLDAQRDPLVSKTALTSEDNQKPLEFVTIPNPQSAEILQTDERSDTPVDSSTFDESDSLQDPLRLDSQSPKSSSELDPQSPKDPLSLDSQSPNGPTELDPKSPQDPLGLDPLIFDPQGLDPKSPQEPLELDIPVLEPPGLNPRQLDPPASQGSVLQDSLGPDSNSPKEAHIAKQSQAQDENQLLHDQNNMIDVKRHDNEPLSKKRHILELAANDENRRKQLATSAAYDESCRKQLSTSAAYDESRRKQLSTSAVYDESRRKQLSTTSPNNTSAVSNNLQDQRKRGHIINDISYIIPSKKKENFKDSFRQERQTIIASPESNKSISSCRELKESNSSHESKSPVSCPSGENDSTQKTPLINGIELNHDQNANRIVGAKEGKKSNYILSNYTEQLERRPNAPNWSPDTPNRSPYSPDRKPYAPDRSSDSTDSRSPYSPDQRLYAPDRKLYAPDRSPDAPDRSSAVSDQRPYALDRRLYAPDRSPDVPDRSPAVSDQRSYVSDKSLDAPDRSTDISDQSPDASDQRSYAPYRSPDAPDGSQDSLNRSPDRSSNTPDQSPDAPDQTSYSPYRSPDAPDGNQDAQNRSPDRSTDTPDQSPDAPDQRLYVRDRSLDEMNRSSDTPDRGPHAQSKSPNNSSSSLDVQDKSPEGLNRSPDAPERIPVAPDQSPDSPDRTPDVPMSVPDASERSTDLPERNNMDDSCYESDRYDQGESQDILAKACLAVGLDEEDFMNITETPDEIPQQIPLSSSNDVDKNRVLYPNTEWGQTETQSPRISHILLKDNGCNSYRQDQENISNGANYVKAGELNKEYLARYPPQYRMQYRNPHMVPGSCYPYPSNMHYRPPYPQHNYSYPESYYYNYRVPRNIQAPPTSYYPPPSQQLPIHKFPSGNFPTKQLRPFHPYYRPQLPYHTGTNGSKSSLAPPLTGAEYYESYIYDSNGKPYLPQQTYSNCVSMEKPIAPIVSQFKKNISAEHPQIRMPNQAPTRPVLPTSKVAEVDKNCYSPIRSPITPATFTHSQPTHQPVMNHAVRSSEKEVLNFSSSQLRHYPSYRDAYPQQITQPKPYENGEFIVPSSQPHNYPLCRDSLPQQQPSQPKPPRELANPQQANYFNQPNSYAYQHMVNERISYMQNFSSKNSNNPPTDIQKTYHNYPHNQNYFHNNQYLQHSQPQLNQPPQNKVPPVNRNIKNQPSECNNSHNISEHGKTKKEITKLNSSSQLNQNCNSNPLNLQRSMKNGTLYEPSTYIKNCAGPFTIEQVHQEKYPFPHSYTNWKVPTATQAIMEGHKIEKMPNPNYHAYQTQSSAKLSQKAKSQKELYLSSTNSTNQAAEMADQNNCYATQHLNYGSRLPSMVSNYGGAPTSATSKLVPDKNSRTVSSSNVIHTIPNQSNLPPACNPSQFFTRPNVTNSVIMGTPHYSSAHNNGVLTHTSAQNFPSNCSKEHQNNLLGNHHSRPYPVILQGQPFSHPQDFTSNVTSQSTNDIRQLPSCRFQKTSASATNHPSHDIAREHFAPINNVSQLPSINNELTSPYMESLRTSHCSEQSENAIRKQEKINQQRHSNSEHTDASNNQLLNNRDTVRYTGHPSSILNCQSTSGKTVGSSHYPRPLSEPTWGPSEKERSVPCPVDCSGYRPLSLPNQISIGSFILNKGFATYSLPDKDEDDEILIFEQKFLPVIDHLLSIPEAANLRPYRDNPDELLVHLVQLWGGIGANSKLEDPYLRMKDNFMTVVKYLFEPHLLIAWGWDKAAPEQILDELLKPSEQGTLAKVAFGGKLGRHISSSGSFGSSSDFLDDDVFLPSHDSLPGDSMPDVFDCLDDVNSASKCDSLFAVKDVDMLSVKRKLENSSTEEENKFGRLPSEKRPSRSSVGLRTGSEREPVKTYISGEFHYQSGCVPHYAQDPVANTRLSSRESTNSSSKLENEAPVDGPRTETVASSHQSGTKRWSSCEFEDSDRLAKRPKLPSFKDVDVFPVERRIHHLEATNLHENVENSKVFEKATLSRVSIGPKLSYSLNSYNTSFPIDEEFNSASSINDIYDKIPDVSIFRLDNPVSSFNQMESCPESLQSIGPSSSGKSPECSTQDISTRKRVEQMLFDSNLAEENGRHNAFLHHDVESPKPIHLENSFTIDSSDILLSENDPYLGGSDASEVNSPNLLAQPTKIPINEPLESRLYINNFKGVSNVSTKESLPQTNNYETKVDQKEELTSQTTHREELNFRPGTIGCDPFSCLQKESELPFDWDELTKHLLQYKETLANKNSHCDEGNSCQQKVLNHTSSTNALEEENVNGSSVCSAEVLSKGQTPINNESNNLNPHLTLSSDPIANAIAIEETEHPTKNSELRNCIKKVGTSTSASRQAFCTKTELKNKLAIIKSGRKSEADVPNNSSETALINIDCNPTVKQKLPLCNPEMNPESSTIVVSPMVKSSQDMQEAMATYEGTNPTVLCHTQSRIVRNVETLQSESNSTKKLVLTDKQIPPEKPSLTDKQFLSEKLLPSEKFICTEKPLLLEKQHMVENECMIEKQPILEKPLLVDKPLSVDKPFQVDLQINNRKTIYTVKNNASNNVSNNANKSNVSTLSGNDFLSKIRTKKSCSSTSNSSFAVTSRDYNAIFQKYIEKKILCDQTVKDNHHGKILKPDTCEDN